LGVKRERQTFWPLPNPNRFNAQQLPPETQMRPFTFLTMLSSAAALSPAVTRLGRSALVRPVVHSIAPRRTPALSRTLPLMADDEDGARDEGVLGELKRRGEQLARDIADAADRLGEALDDGLDAVLGPRPSPLPGLVPIPIPVDPPYGQGGYGNRGYGGYDGY
jgi:hypothetical protein